MVCKPRFITFYSSIIVALCCLAGLSVTTYHFFTSQSCDENQPNATIVEEVESTTGSTTESEIPTERCHKLECTLTVLSTFAATILAALMGFEGSRRATSEKNCATCLYIFQFILGFISLLGLLGSLILVSFPQLIVCPGIYKSFMDPIYLTLLITLVLSFLLLLLSVCMGVKTKRNMKYIEYKSGALY